MLKKISNFLLLFIFALALAVIQFSLITPLASFFQYFNPGIIALIFILFFFGLKPAFCFIFFFAIFLDFLVFQFFGFYTLALIMATLVVFFILKNWLTNKSLYSFIATIFIFIFLYNLFLASIYFIATGFSTTFAPLTAQFYKIVLWQIAWGLIAAVLLFNILVSWLKKFKPFFLENKRFM